MRARAHVCPRRPPFARSPSPCTSQNGKTALMHAAEEGQTACVTALLDGGAEVNAKDKVRGLEEVGLVGSLRAS